MKIGAIVQARTSSTRLPGKVLKELPTGSGITVLEQVVRRLKKVGKINTVVIATTTDVQDDAIVDIARKENVPFFRGSRDNVLSRFYLAAEESDLDVVVRVTSDCPCVDPDVVGLLIEQHLDKATDYTSNTLDRTYPLGLDAEVISFKALEKAYNEAKESFEKEHVSTYIYKSRPDLFKIDRVLAPEELYAPDIRVALDTREDYILLCAVFDLLKGKTDDFNARDIISLFRERPWLGEINGKTLHKKVCASLEEEIEETINLLDSQDLYRASEFIRTKIKDIEQGG